MTGYRHQPTLSSTINDDTNSESQDENRINQQNLAYGTVTGAEMPVHGGCEFGWVHVSRWRGHRWHQRRLEEFRLERGGGRAKGAPGGDSATATSTELRRMRYLSHDQDASERDYKLPDIYVCTST